MDPHQNPAQNASPVIRVSLIEDDTFFLGSFVKALTGTPDIQLVHAATTLAEGKQVLSQDAVDVLIVDLGLPDGSGIDLIKKAHRKWPHCAVLVSTTFADELHVIQSIEAGASGYLLKDSQPELIVEEIRSIQAGGSPISPLIARHVLNRFRLNERQSMPARSDSGTEQSPEDARTLSAREFEVLNLLTKGFNYEEIGNLLNIAHNTVKTFVRRIYGKLEVKSKAEAIHEARIHGLLRD
jgi:DNA-binding NarL/FixJ family response regulator